MDSTDRQELIENDNLMTTGEVAEYLNASPVKVRQLARDGEIPSIRLKDSENGHRRFIPADVRAFVQNRKAKNEKDQAQR